MEFGHHPEPAIDFCTEVECIEAEITDRAAGLPATMDLGARIDLAMQFKVGGSAAAVVAKADLRKYEAAFKAGAASGVQGTPEVHQVRDVSVGVMTEGGGRKTYFVCINRADGERVTPHSFTAEWQAEYEVREYADFFGVRGLDAKGDDLPDSGAIMERWDGSAIPGVPVVRETKENDRD